MWFCVGLPNFIQIGPSAAELWRLSDFQDGSRQPCWICCGVMVDHTRSVADSCCYVFKFWLDRIHSFGDCAILDFRVLAWNWIFTSNFMGFWGIGLLHRNDVTYRPNPHEAPSCVEIRRLSHKAWKSVEVFDLCAWSKRRTEQESQKSHKGVIFHLVVWWLPSWT